MQTQMLLLHIKEIPLHLFYCLNADELGKDLCSAGGRDYWIMSRRRCRNTSPIN